MGCFGVCRKQLDIGIIKMDINRRKFLETAFKVGGITGLYMLGSGAVEEAMAWGLLNVSGSGAAATCVEGNDTNTILMIHSDTTDGSTTFTDSGNGPNNPHTINNFNSVHHEVDDQKFGATSINFEKDTSDYLTVDDHADWAMGDTWTIDWWINWQTVGNTYLMGQFVGAGEHYWIVTYVGGNLGLDFVGDNTGGSDSFGAWVPSTGIWYHVAIVATAAGVTAYIDGTSLGSVDAHSIADNASDLFIGQLNGASYFDGYIDEFRISDVARWSANFTPSTVPYCDT